MLAKLVAGCAVVALSVLAAPPPPDGGPVSPRPVANTTVFGQFTEAVSVKPKALAKCLRKAKTVKAKKRCKERVALAITPVTPTPDETAGDAPTPPGQTTANPATPTKGQPVAPAYAPVGSAQSYSLLSEQAGRAAHWNYCKPIKYLINPTGLSAQARGDLDAALVKVAAASGLRFEYAGETATQPFVTRDWYSTFSPDEQTLVVAGLTSDQLPSLRGWVAGIGGSTWIDDGASEPRYFAAGLAIDTEENLTPGFVARGMGVLLLHEFGHVVGLGHVNDPTQIMNPAMTSEGPTDYQAGDLAGLAKLSSFNCF